MRLARFAPAALAVAAVAASALAMLPAPKAAAPAPHADYAVIVGVAGLRWDDIDQRRTPALWQLASNGAIGALSVRSARPVTCPQDGWLTLGAGNRVKRSGDQPGTGCEETEVPLQAAGALPGQEADDSQDLPPTMVTDQLEVVRQNRASNPSAQPGALAEAVRCTTAVGSGAAIAAARPYGRVDHYTATLGDRPEHTMAVCALTIVDAGSVDGTGADRAIQAGEVDRSVAAVLAAAPERSLVIVAGLSDTQQTGRLHAAIASGPGYSRGWLTSATTARNGYVELADLAPTALRALDRPVPDHLFSGAAATRVGDRPAGVAAAIDRLADADRQASAQRHVTAWFIGVLVGGLFLLYVAMIVVLRRIHRARTGRRANARGGAGAGGKIGGGAANAGGGVSAGGKTGAAASAGGASGELLPDRQRRWCEISLVAAALTVPAALISDIVPWWRLHWSGPVFTVVTLVLVALGTGTVLLTIGRGRALGALGGVAAGAACAVAVDVMTGSRLQLNGVAGYSAVSGSRYAGVGTVGLGILSAGLLLLAGTVVQRVPKPWRGTVVMAIGAVGIVVVGSPYLGADTAGAVGLSAGVCIAAVSATGGWITVTRLISAVLTAGAVGTGLALLDMFRPAQRRGTIGRFLVALFDTSESSVAHHLWSANVRTVMTSPMTLLAIGSTLFVGFVLMRSWGGLRRLFGLYPAVRAAVVGVAVATGLAGLMEGVGFNVLAAALAMAVPLLTLAVIQVQLRAVARTGVEPVGSAETTASAAAPAAGTGRTHRQSTPARDAAEDGVSVESRGSRDHDTGDGA